jgi:hypothetical protein
MRVQGRFGLATALVLVIPSFVQAQRATGTFRAAPSGSAPVQASAPVAHVTASSAGVGAASAGASASAPARVHTGSRVASPHPVRSGAAGSSAGHSNFGTNNFGNFGAGGDGLSVQQILNPVPGFGFDYEYLAAIHKDDNIKAFIDPATQARLAVARRRLRREHLGSGGFVLLDGGGAYAIPADDLNGDANAEQAPAGEDAQQQGQQGQQQQQQPIIIIQQPAAVSQGGGLQGALDAQNGTQQQEEAPMRDVGEFTLVLMSGREIETVAFTRANDKIVYITSEGGRRTLAVGELDIDATVRLNQERGTPLQLPL